MGVFNRLTLYVFYLPLLVFAAPAFIRKPKRALLFGALTSIVSIALNGCGDVNRALNSVDSAIKELDKGNKTFAQMKDILEGLKVKLDKGEYKDQVDALIGRVGNVAEVGGQAFVDFTRERVIQDLTNLKLSFQGKPPMPRIPKLANAESPKIDFASSSRSTLTIVGWNLDVAQKNPNKYKVVVKNSRNPGREVDNQYISFQGQYAVTINTSTNGLRFQNYDTKLVFDGFDPVFEIAIVNSSPLPPPTPVRLPADVSGVLINNGDGKVTFLIHYTGINDQTTIVIRRANKNMWWKKVVLKNDAGDITSVETKDNDEGREITVQAGHLVGNLKLAFGKAGAFALWKGVHEMPVTKEYLLGKRLTYTWEKD